MCGMENTLLENVKAATTCHNVPRLLARTVRATAPATKTLTMPLRSHKAARPNTWCLDKEASRFLNHVNRFPNTTRQVRRHTACNNIKI